jgi:beta-aspartyl-peptidase (threonine type)
MTALIVHGGAWDIPDNEVEAHKAGCLAALAAGWAILNAGGSALDAVEAAVRSLEDDPTYDAGVGSFLNAIGEVELDAAIMDGNTMLSGAVAAVQRVRHPITLARRVLESDYILLVGTGAESFAQTAGVELCSADDLVVDRERARWKAQQGQPGFRGRDAFRAAHDTVGAVALDAAGNLAAATSTGGIPNKLPGRVGDSPLLGSGLYADNETGGCSTTGWGESIMKVVLAKTVTDGLRDGSHPRDAAQSGIRYLARRVDGLAGCIVLDRAGRVGWAHNTPRMAFAYRADGQDPVVAIHQNDVA